MATPAEKLEGSKLTNGWIVTKKIEPSSVHTGGNFSCTYIVESATGKKAFLKALDYTKALRDPNPAQRLKELIDSFLFEKLVLEKCKERNFDKIVIALDFGKTQAGPSPYDVVEYIIFELAKHDLRDFLNISKKFDLAWTLRTLHQITVGLNQLHNIGIAHQDLKPSNVLIFDKNIAKLTDVGRASQKGETPPHEKYTIAGDPAYAPPELLYRHLENDWNTRRIGCDLYLLGSMIIFFITDLNINSLLKSKLDSKYNWNNWSGSYTDVLPMVEDAFDLVVVDFQNLISDKEVGIELGSVIRQLCNPNPTRRGHPKDKVGFYNKYSLIRYISKFDVLAKKAEYNIMRGI